jgi:hypothetical protein
VALSTSAEPSSMVAAVKSWLLGTCPSRRDSSRRCGVGSSVFSMPESLTAYRAPGAANAPSVPVSSLS